MQINHLVELPDGSVKFQGTLEGPELAIVLEAGLNLLLGEGALPFVSKETADNKHIHEMPDYDQ